MKYYVNDDKNVRNLGKLYFLSKIHRRLSNVPSQPVISNCGNPTKQISKFLDCHVKPVMHRCCSYIKDSGDFIEKIVRTSNMPDDVILVAINVLGLNPGIAHKLGLNVLEKAKEKRDFIQISISDLIRMAIFVLQNNYFEFNGETKQYFWYCYRHYVRTSISMDIHGPS